MPRVGCPGKGLGVASGFLHPWLWEHKLCPDHGWWLCAALPQLLRIDVSTLDLASSRLDAAVAICFGPAPPSHLLVSTSSNKVVVLDATSGHVVREVSPGSWLVPWPPLGSHLGVPSALRRGDVGPPPERYNF